MEQNHKKVNPLCKEENCQNFLKAGQKQNGSVNPTMVIVPVPTIVATLFSTVVEVINCKIMEKNYS